MGESTIADAPIAAIPDPGATTPPVFNAGWATGATSGVLGTGVPT